MADMKLNREQYDALLNEYRERNNYDSMSLEQKEEFNQKLEVATSELFEVEDEGDDSREAMGEKSIENIKLRDELRDRYDYDNMSAEEQKRFDIALDSTCDKYDSLYESDYSKSEAVENTEETEKVYKLR